MQILVINSGSATQKMALVKIENEGALTETLWEDTQNLDSDANREQVIAKQLQLLKEISKNLSFDGLGHRVVHGGSLYQQTELINQEVMDDIESLRRLAPIHNPPAFESIKYLRERFPGLPQFAVFDTAFHTTIPEFNHRYAIPRKWFQEHDIRKYGFHGISHQACHLKACKLVLDSQRIQKMVSCHLGGGSSVTAILEGKSFDTTMGFTPLEGLVMATRSGSIDPAIVTFMEKAAGMKPAEIERALNYESGIKGIFELSSDMKELLAARDSEDPNAMLAFDIYIASLKKAIASMAASIGGLDLLAFTGGIGENSSIVREAVLKSLEFLGIKLDDSLNRSPKEDSLISKAGSPVLVAVIKCDESAQIARSCYSQLQLTS